MAPDDATPPEPAPEERPDLGLAGVDTGPGPMTVLALASLVPGELAEPALVEVVGLLDEQVAWLHALRAAHLAELAERHAADPVPGPEPLAPGQWREGRESYEPQWERETVGLRCGVTDYDARVRLETATALHTRLPATARLLARGGVSWPHAVALAQETAGLDAARSGDVERRVLADTRARTAGQFRRRALRLAATLRPVPDPDAEPERSLTAWAETGGLSLRVRLTAAGGAVVATALDAPATRTDAADERSVATRRADALVELCQWRLDAGDLPPTPAGQRPHVTLTVPLTTLTGTDELPAGLGRVDVPPAAARRISCDAGVATLVHTATVVDLGREARVPTPALRRRLEARDGGCRFPTCTRPVHRCHAHHVVHWAAGGATDESNLLLLCSRHHHLVHEGGWQLSFDGRTTRWRTPAGVAWTGPPPLARPPEPDEPFYAWLPDPPGSRHIPPCRGHTQPAPSAATSVDPRDESPPF